MAKVTVNGNCCVKIYARKWFRGSKRQFLSTGFDEEPNFDKVRSVQFVSCDQE